MDLGQAVGIAKGAITSKIIAAGGPGADIGIRIANQMMNRPAPINSNLTPGGHHWMERARARSDPIPDNYWYVELPVLNGGDTRLSWEYVEEATLPLIEFDEISNYRAGKSYHYPSHYNLNPLQLKFYGDVDGLSLKYLYTWQNLILNKDTGLYFPPAIYKQPIIITILDPAHATVAVLQYRGCWPTVPDNIPLISGQSGRLTFNVSFRVDELNVLVAKFPDAEKPSLLSAIGKDYPTSLARLPSVFPNAFSSVPGNLLR